MSAITTDDRRHKDTLSLIDILIEIGTYELVSNALGALNRALYNLESRLAARAIVLFSRSCTSVKA